MSGHAPRFRLRPLRTTLLTLALGTLVPGAAFAQSGWSLDVGGAQVRFSDSLALASTSVAPTLRLERGPVAFTAAGSFASLEGGAWSVQGGLGLSAFTRAVGPLRGELAASAGGSAHRDGSRSSQAAALARAHVGGVFLGGWLGAGGGTAHDGIGARPLALAEGAVWARARNAIVVASVTPTRVGSGTTAVNFADLQLTARVVTPRIELAATGATRAGDAFLRAGRSSWGSLTATGWATSWLGVTASGGTYAIDPTQGFPGGRFVSAAVRLRRAPAALRPAARTRTLAPLLGGVEVATAGDRRVLRVFAPAATAVEVTGDFTDWLPVPLARAGEGWWRLDQSLTAGLHELRVRLDGGAWEAPPGLTRREDDFGGEVGLLVVP